MTHVSNALKSNGYPSATILNMSMQKSTFEVIPPLRSQWECSSGQTHHIPEMASQFYDTSKVSLNQVQEFSTTTASEPPPGCNRDLLSQHPPQFLFLILPLSVTFLSFLPILVCAIEELLLLLFRLPWLFHLLYQMPQRTLSLSPPNIHNVTRTFLSQCALFVPWVSHHQLHQYSLVLNCLVF